MTKDEAERFVDVFFNIDWNAAFAPTVAIAEIVMRGSLVYLGIFAILRFVLRREAGTIGMPDLLMMVLIADAASNAMASQYKSIPEGLILVGTLVFWNYSLDRFDYRFPALRRFLYPPPLALVKDGRLIRRNLRREMITEEELMSSFRQQGVGSLSEVKTACIESDGRISVIGRDSKGGKGEKERRSPM